MAFKPDQQPCPRCGATQSVWLMPDVREAAGGAVRWWDDPALECLCCGERYVVGGRRVLAAPGLDRTEAFRVSVLHSSA